jgi:predicted GNAT family N-acyltransferase
MNVRKVSTEAERQQAFRIREEVFVKEQQVAPEEEYDEFDETATHFIAYDAQQQAIGTARWRVIDRGIKLERFAVLDSHRCQGVGAALLQAILKDIGHSAPGSGSIYLHAQTTAVPFYEKYGFRKVGDEFEECQIKHFKMIYS